MNPRILTSVAASVCCGLLALGAHRASGQDPLADLNLDLDPKAPASPASPGEAPGIDLRFSNKLLEEAERYSMGRGQRYNPKRAYEIFYKVAQSGNPIAVFHVARCLITGEGVAPSPEKGNAMLEDLAESLIQTEGFRLRSGVNPVTGEKFKRIADIRFRDLQLADFTTNDGKAIESTKVLDINDQGIRLMHSTGISNFAWRELPGSVRRQIGYDEISLRFEDAIRAALAKRAK